MAASAGTPPATGRLQVGDIDTIAARLEVLGFALQEMARVLEPGQAEQAARALRRRVDEFVGHAKLDASTDEAISAEVAPLLAALGRR
jgi:hypothetical protein